MEILGYKYTNEQDAINARKQCADYYGLPKAPDDVTQYWVDYETARYDKPVFWYIVFQPHRQSEAIFQMGKKLLYAWFT